MRKSEYAYDQVQRYLDGRGEVTAKTLIGQAWLFTDDGDPRWIGAALHRLNDAGRLRFPSCSDGHDHVSSGCAVELIGA